MKNFQRIIAGAFLTFLFVISSGCASVNPKPFQDYEVSTRRLQDGMETVFIVDRQMTTEGFIQKVVDGDSKSLKELSLQFPAKTSPFEIAFEGAPPIFITIAQAERRMASLNRAFSDYAALLVMLAGSEVVNQETFDSLAKDLNGNILDTANQLKKQGVTIPDNINQGIGIVSIAAAEGFRAYIENKRRESLKEALDKNQTIINQWSVVALNALENIGLDVQHEYERKRGVLSKLIVSGGVDSEIKTAKVQELVLLNTSMFDIMGVLQELSLAYSKMPAAHANLAESIDNEEFSLPDLKSYYDQARHLQSLYKSISQ